MVVYVFGDRITDMLSGYRVLSRHSVKSFPALSASSETDFTIHALELNLSVSEVRTAYRNCPAGSASKLSTFANGFRLLRTSLLW
ncbi:hypothetical protein ACFQS7_08320 [Dankookia sp. GCM10030260]|uniref:hypothetical protein n=1 Tax=Dankookia sp. GCM10030260 TaxID=3273390 RepID=UPI0036202036